MDVLILTLIASLALAAGGVFFLIKRIRAGDVEHGDRLSLLPLADDDPGQRTNPSEEDQS